LFLEIFWRVLIPKITLILAENQYSARHPYAPSLPKCPKIGISVWCLFFDYFWLIYKFLWSKFFQIGNWLCHKPWMKFGVWCWYAPGVLVRTGLDKILKIHEILTFLTYFKHFFLEVAAQIPGLKHSSCNILSPCLFWGILANPAHRGSSLNTDFQPKWVWFSGSAPKKCPKTTCYCQSVDYVPPLPSRSKNY